MNVCPNSILRSLHTVLPDLLKPSITFACLRPFLFCYSNLTNQLRLAILLSLIWPISLVLPFIRLMLPEHTCEPSEVWRLEFQLAVHYMLILLPRSSENMNPPVLDNLKWVGNTATDDLASHNNLETQPLPPLQPSFFLSVCKRCLYPEHPPHTRVYDWRHVSLQHTGCMYNGCSGEFNTSSPQPRLSPKHAFLWCTRLKRLRTIQK